MTLQFIPCARNDNVGEQITRNFLTSSFNHADGILLGNYHLSVGNGTRECDFILLNQRGIWVIEVKNWRGRIKIDRTKWHRDDGLIQHSPLISVETKAKILAETLERERFTNISVVGLVVLAQSTAELQNAGEVKKREPREDKIFHLDDRFIRALTGRNYLYKTTNKELDMRLMQRISDTLIPHIEDSLAPKWEEIIGDSYRIQDYLGPGPDEMFHAYKAKHVTIPGRYARAKKYYTPVISSTGDLRETTHSFQRDMQALSKLEHHPNILQVYDYLPDHDSNDIYWLLLEWIKGITLQEWLEAGPVPLREQISILHSVLNALDACHSNSILHRNLSPSCIYLANDGTVKIGDFDFARVPSLSKTLTYPEQPAPWQSSRYTAPELQKNAREADVRSDLYAVGAIWYDMLFRPEPYEEIDLSRLEQTELSAEARDLLTRLLSSDPNERPRNARAVKRWLELVQDQNI